MAEPVTRRPGRPALPGRREEILDAATRALSEHGLEGLSLTQLAHILGVSTYAFTYHFGSKEDLIAAVVEHVESSLQAEFKSLIDSPDTNLQELVRRYWATTRGPGARESLRLWLDIVLLASREPQRLPGILDRAALDWRPIIAAALEDHPQASELATLAFAAITGLEIVQLIDSDPTSSDRALEAFISMFEASLTPGPTRPTDEIQTTTHTPQPGR